MKNKVIKSLFDKTVDEFYYNPQIVVNERSKNIKSRIIENLKKANKIDIAISYVVWSGLSLIYQELKRFDKSSRILVTTEGFVTDPTSLRRLKDLNLSVKVYNPFDKETKGFHLKSYCFSKENDKTILIGSNNISARAFGMSHEMMVEVDSKNEGYIVSEYSRVFEELWNNPQSVELTDEFIKGYEKLFNEKQRLDNKFYEYKLTNEKIKPNYMQEKALKYLKEYREQGYDKGLVIAATGTGKTYLSAFDVKETNADKVLFLVHNRLILTNAIDTYKKVFPSKNSLELKSNNIKQVDKSEMIFTTDKTAHTHLYKKVGKDYFDYIIYDEAHRIGEDTLYNDLINYFEPKFTLGITATPERTQNPDYLFEVFDYSVPYEIRLLDALDHELICPFTYYGLSIKDNLLDTNERFDYFNLALFIKEQIKEKRHYGQKLKALLFAKDIQEAKAINEKLNFIGFNSVVAVSGSSTQEDIEAYIESLKSNQLNTVEIICTVNKFNEGIDIPDINMIIMLRNTKSSIIYLQQLGRGLRRTSDPNKFVTVLDLIGNSNNNYSIAQVLTGNETADKRSLYSHVATNFEQVSPFINVYIEEKAKENILKSISNNFTVKTILSRKFKEELSRYKEIPRLIDLYKNPYLHELDLLQLLYKSFYEAFENYYHEKYQLPKDNYFLRHFFRLLIQFVFRGYNSEQLESYATLLKGNEIKDDFLMRVLLPQKFNDGIPSAVNSNYNRRDLNLIEPFLLTSQGIKINEKLITKLKDLNAYDLYLEHIELIEELAKKESYKMKTYELVEKAEFLFNVGSNDYYMTGIGEKIDHDKKVVYCTIKITKDESHYDNYIIDEQTFVYHTQNTNTKKQAKEKVEKLINENYTFKICAQFPHLGYSNTSYFNLGNIKPVKVSDVKENKPGRYNNEITFKLEEKLPEEFLLYKM